MSNQVLDSDGSYSKTGISECTDFMRRNPIPLAGQMLRLAYLSTNESADCPYYRVGCGSKSTGQD